MEASIKKLAERPFKSSCRRETTRIKSKLWEKMERKPFAEGLEINRLRSTPDLMQDHRALSLIAV